MSIYSRKSTEELNRLIALGSKNTFASTKAAEELALRAKKAPEGEEEQMDTIRLRRKGIQKEAAIQVVSLLTGSKDIAKIERFLESYNLDLSKYDSFHITQTFKKFS